MSVMNSRRLIASPKAQDKASCQLKIAHWKRSGAALGTGIERLPNVRFGSKADISECPVDVRYSPKS